MLYFGENYAGIIGTFSVISSCKSHEIYIVSTMSCVSIVYPNPNLI